MNTRDRPNFCNHRHCWFALAHRKLDTAVAAADAWPAELTPDQILERLLALNLERAERAITTPSLRKPRGN